ncbi:Cytoskeleton-associated protein 2 [Myotis brandtii]|uniref:Cytoskeleton-associated protein 2 n=1 Tax=Myotis brandtii TaxID=109478 RepID=S7NJU8_MYOBR|nr:Cytoskeleton-associated protein 2 [Myotis brandtii]
MMTSEGLVQEETKVLKLKTKMADKENVHRPTRSKNNVTMGKNCIPLKPSNELTNSTIATDIYNLENNQTLQLLPITNDRQGQRMTLSQAFHIKNNNKKKQVTTEKPKQDANVLKKPVLGSYRGQIVQSKIEKSKTIDQCRHTIAKATINRRAQPKETVEERKARLSEWRASKGKMLKRPPSSVITQPKPEGQNEKPVGSFWTTLAEEDEQRLLTEKVNKTFSECLNLINEGCPKEEVLNILSDLIKNIPDAKKLVKYWICLARLEPLTSSIENIISIFEKAILAGAQPIEEMRHVIADILTMRSQEKVKFGENPEEACATKEKIQEVNIEDIGVNLESGKPEMENKHHRNVVFQDCKKEQVHKTKDPTNDVKTPNKETRGDCLIKYIVSTTPYLQSVKKKMQFDEINSTSKKLKFLTPVRRSQRLQNKTSKLPDMLKNHYPCVSSLEQLTELEDKTDAFICRPNAALGRMYLETETIEDK